MPVTKKDLVMRVCDLIGEGKLDNYLEAVMAECNNRRVVVREAQARRNARELGEIGTRVRIASGRPKYIVGQTGEVVPKPIAFIASNKPLIYVKLDRGIIRKYGPVVGCPPGMLEAE